MQFNKLTNVKMEDVKLKGGLLGAIQDLIVNETIPYQYDVLNDNVEGAPKSHAIANFRIAAGEQKGEFYGMFFQDSDVAKWLEAASYSLILKPDPQLEKILDDLVDLIGRAQEPDGYLNTYFTVAHPDKKWTNLRDLHELYCAGHMMEAAVAYYRATGKTKLIDIMSKFTDHMLTVLGPEPGKKRGYPGHPEIELALVKMYKVTGDQKYLRLAKFFIDERGRQPHYFAQEAELRGEKRKNAEQDNMWSTYHYYQAHLPLKEQTTAEGHAVRAMYLFSGAADVARETGDEELFEALKKLWDNVTKKRMYITAAIGSQSYGEAFSLDYDLPNDTIYGETCASIGLAFFAHRMLQMDPDRKYADVLERAIYNGILSGISLDGKKFFYVNPLEVVPEVCEKRHDHFHVKVERQAWFACACCPANVSRLYTSIGDYIYSTSNDGEIYIHLFANSSANIALGDRNVVLDVNTRYPWDGNINIKVNPDLKGEFTIAVRVPSWCHEPSIRVNGQPVNIEEHMDKGYVKIKRVWEPGDAIDVVYPMKAMLVRTNPRVRENAGKVAIQRGPMVYCIEEVDNGKNLHNIIVPKDVEFKETFEEGLLNGVVAIIFKAYRLKDWPCDECYSFDQNSYEEIEVKAIPYYAWGNRGVGEMTVWMREEMCI
nr:hypothetical protein [Clostridia bacterium]